ncbi:MAG: hypothetical protein V1819_00805 [bacterium]
MPTQEEILQKISEIQEYIDSAFATMKEIVKDHDKFLIRILELSYRVVTVVGIVAGFGFTGISSVINRNLFFIGEIFLFGVIFLGIFWLKKIYTDTKNIYNGYVNKIEKYIKDWEKIGLEVARGNFEHYTKDKIKEMEQAAEDIFEERLKNTDKVFSLMLLLFAVGSIILLSSFLDYNFSQILCRIIR